MLTTLRQLTMVGFSLLTFILDRAPNKSKWSRKQSIFQEKSREIIWISRGLGSSQRSVFTVIQSKTTTKQRKCSKTVSRTDRINILYARCQKRFVFFRGLECLYVRGITEIFKCLNSGCRRPSLYRLHHTVRWWSLFCGVKNRNGQYARRNTNIMYDKYSTSVCRQYNVMYARRLASSRRRATYEN